MLRKAVTFRIVCDYINQTMTTIQIKFPNNFFTNDSKFSELYKILEFGDTWRSTYIFKAQWYVYVPSIFNILRTGDADLRF
jgi:hypothetical protein